MITDATIWERWQARIASDAPITIEPVGWVGPRGELALGPQDALLKPPEVEGVQTRELQRWYRTRHRVR